MYNKIAVTPGNKLVHDRHIHVYWHWKNTKDRQSEYLFQNEIVSKVGILNYMYHHFSCVFFVSNINLIETASLS